MRPPRASSASLEPDTEPLDAAVARAAASAGPAPLETSALEVLLAAEIGRTRRLALIGAGIGAAAAASLPILGGEPIAVAIGASGLAVFGLSNLFLYRAAREEASYRRGVVLAGWLLAMAGLLAACTYFGLFSVAMIGPAVGIYYVSQSQRRRDALIIYLASAICFGGVMSLIALGVIEDLGRVDAARLSSTQKLLTVALLELVMFGIYRLGCHARSVLLAAVEAMQGARAAARQSRALKDEAEQALRRAVHAGGPGRLSGMTIEGYRLDSLIGRGAMGEVYEAVDPRGEPVAMKVLHERADDVATRRFLREQQTLVALRAPNIVEVLEVSSDGELPYIVMERLRGRDLATYLRERERLHAPEVAGLLADVGSGLDAAAARGIVHRDLKPGNVFRVGGDADPTWKILDFSISIALDADSSLTSAGAVIGTPAYMPPEQARGAPVDHAADLYALGAIAYRCVTGQPPFRSADVPSLLARLVSEMPDRPSSLVRLPPDVDRFFAIALAKRPGDRFASGAELADAFAAAWRGELDLRWRARASQLLASQPWGGIR